MRSRTAHLLAGMNHRHGGRSAPAFKRPCHMLAWSGSPHRRRRARMPRRSVRRCRVPCIRPRLPTRTRPSREPTARGSGAAAMQHNESEDERLRDSVEDDPQHDCERRAFRLFATRALAFATTEAVAIQAKPRRGPRSRGSAGGNEPPSMVCGRRRPSTRRLPDRRRACRVAR